MSSIDIHGVLVLAGTPILGATIVTGIRHLARPIQPGTALNFLLTRIPLYSYIALGLLLLTAGLSSLEQQVGTNFVNFSLMAAGWLIGLVLLWIFP